VDLLREETGVEVRKADITVDSMAEETAEATAEATAYATVDEY
jgi:hypothetical protein